MSTRIEDQLPLLDMWRSVSGPRAELNGPLIRYAALVAEAVLSQRETALKALIAAWRDDAKEYSSAHFAICANDLEEALAEKGADHV